MSGFQDTVSRAVEAAHLFSMPEADANRRRKRSAEPSRALDFQFRRVQDVVGSEAIVLCDQRGRKLSGLGDDSFCRMLSRAVPNIAQGSRSQVSYQFKALDLLRPGIDTTHLAVSSIAIPKQRKRLFVASVGESIFNHAGIEHATTGVRRILGVPDAARPNQIVTSRDRLAYDLGRAMQHGFNEFNSSELAQRLRRPRRGRPGRGEYQRALTNMLGRIEQRLGREGLLVDRPGLRERFFAKDIYAGVDGYRNRRFGLPIRFARSGKQWGVLNVELTLYERQFQIPKAPTAVLQVI